MAPAAPEDAAVTKPMPTTAEMISMPANTFSIPAIHMARARWNAGGGSQRLMTILREPDNVSAFRQLVVATTMMLLLPLGTMVASYYFLLEQFFTFRNDGQKVLYSGIAGLGMVQVVVVWFVVSAMREPAEAAPAASRPHAE